MPKTPELTDERADSKPEGRPGGRGINQIMLVGRLARDPELRSTEQGVPRAWFVLAVPRNYAGKDGDRDADFVNIIAWRQLASVVSEHLQKGRLVGIVGRLQVSSFEAQDGSRRSTTEVIADQIVFLDAPRKPAKPDN